MSAVIQKPPLRKLLAQMVLLHKQVEVTALKLGAHCLVVIFGDDAVDHE